MIEEPVIEWRNHLTQREADEVERLDEIIRTQRERVTELRGKLNIIRQRAAQRHARKRRNEA